MTKSTITIDVHLNNQKIPDQITWSATDSTMESAQQARAMILSLWDGTEKTALGIELWTKEMMVDEMADFFYQTFMTMADTYERAVTKSKLDDDIRSFAREFFKKFREEQMQENRLS